MSLLWIINGWAVYAHPQFLSQRDKLIRQVERLWARAREQGDPDGYLEKRASKRLAAIIKLTEEVIPSDPGHASFRQGLTLGPDRSRIQALAPRQVLLTVQIVLPLPPEQQNDYLGLVQRRDHQKRTYGAKSDAYHVFQDMLRRGCPPNDWNTLVAEANRS